MKLTCVTAVYNAIKSGNRENLIRCVRSVAALKTPHEHLIYDGGSTDGTVELLRELEREIHQKVGGESRWTTDGSAPRGCNSPNCTSGGISPKCPDGIGHSSSDAIGTIASTVDRRRCAEKKVAEWLSGVDEATFEAALVRLVEEKTAAGEYRFKKPEERELALEGARKFYREFARKIVPLSDGRYVYFAPDERAKIRNASNAISWAEYAFHAVSNGGAKVPEKNYNERWYNPHKQPAFALIEGVLKQEKCFIRLSSAGARFHAIVFAGTEDASSRLQVVTRLDDVGNIDVNLSEVTFTASHKEKKLPRLVPLTEAVRTVVHYQTATGSYPPNGSSIANPRGDDKGGEGESGALIERALPENDNSAVDLLSRPTFSHPRLRVVSEPDTGIYNALNKGVRDAQGEWFYVLGCDDYLARPYVLDSIVSSLKNEAIVVTDVYWNNDDSGREEYRLIDCASIYWSTPYSHQGVIMNLEAIRRHGGFDEKYKIAADYKLFLQCHLCRENIRYSPGSSNVFASFGTDGVSGLDRSRMINEFNAVLAECLSLPVEQVIHFRQRGYLPIRFVIKGMRNPDRAIRLASRAMGKTVIKRMIRCVVYPLVVVTRPLRYRIRR